ALFGRGGPPGLRRLDLPQRHAEDLLLDRVPCAQRRVDAAFDFFDQHPGTVADPGSAVRRAPPGVGSRTYACWSRGSRWPKNVRPMSDRGRSMLEPERPQGASCGIVGIGASAGGLQALEAFFQHLPPASG